MIISEIGINHMGDMRLATKLISLAKENGADLAKFQLYDTDRLSRKPEIMRGLRRAELSKEQAFKLFEYGKSIGMEIFFSVFDVERVKWCEDIGVNLYKVAHSQQDNIELRCALNGKNIIVSTDTPWPEAKNLYCVPKYPAEIYDYKVANLEWYNGVSDHTIGLNLVKIVLARKPNAVIEKHFAIDHKTGADASWSMDDKELYKLKKWEQLCQQLLSRRD